MKRPKINEFIHIGWPLSRTQRCVMCGGEIVGLGVTIKLNHPTTNLYCWIHVGCIKKLSETKSYFEIDFSTVNNDVVEKGINDYDGQKFNFRRSNGFDQTCLCSFCNGPANEEHKLMAFPHFRLHRDCAKKVAEEVARKFEEHADELTARFV